MISRLSVIFLVVNLLACAAKPLQWNSNDYTVKSGDTLYSIAWRFELAIADLVQWNQLTDSTLIHPGQRLHTVAPRNSVKSLGNTWLVSTTIRQPKIKTIVVKHKETLYSIAADQKLSVKQLAAYNHLKKPYLIKPGQILNLGPTSKLASNKPKLKSRPKIKTSSSSVSNKLIRWQWPVKGKIIKTFNKRLNNAKGIDIAGVEGKSVKAAAAGKVVYSGNGLISYGNLIIIKHNSQFLSAYAHNRKLLVKEGDKVKVGQVIAELGQSSAKNPRLHFEIRRNGKPVNPIHYLPSS